MTPEIERHVSANMNLSRKQIMLANFLGGLSWGIGSVIGASVVITIIVWLLKLFGVFNDFSNFFPQNFR